MGLGCYSWHPMEVSSIFGEAAGKTFSVKVTQGTDVLKNVCSGSVLKNFIGIACRLDLPPKSNHEDIPREW